MTMLFASIIRFLYSCAAITSTKGRDAPFNQQTFQSPKVIVKPRACLKQQMNWLWCDLC